MTFWMIIVAMAVLAAAILAIAVLRGQGGVAPAAAYDLRVYQDQLNEVDRDLARGVLAQAEADRTRTEISRRILAADAQNRKDGAPGGAAPTRTALIAALGLVTVGGSLWLYSTLGQPGYSDLPRTLRETTAAAARATRPSQAAAEADMPQATALHDPTGDYGDLVERLRETVKARPDDLEGHVLLARNEAALGNFVASYKAHARVLRLKGKAASGQDYLDYAHMMILAAGGYVSPEAEAVLAQVLQREPTNGAAQYYVGLMYAQTGRPDRTFRIWHRLLSAGPPDAPWMPPIRAQIEEIARLAGQHRFALPPEATAPAADMPPEDREMMVRGMVDGLAERLATDGGTVEEWARLLRALGVLGDRDRARAIHAEALQVFAADPDSIAMIRQATAGMGLDE